MMPYRKAIRGAGEMPAHYEVCFLARASVSPAGADIDFVRAERRKAVREREEMLAAQKACGRQNPAAARYYSALAAQWLRRERACGLVLGWLGVGPWRNFEDWPEELAPDCDWIFSALLYRP